MRQYRLTIGCRAVLVLPLTPIQRAIRGCPAPRRPAAPRATAIPGVFLNPKLPLLELVEIDLRASRDLMRNRPMDVRLAHEAATTLVGLLLEKDPVRVEMFVERGHLLRRRGNACHRRGCHLYWNDSRCDGDDDAICPHAIPPPENRKRQALAQVIVKIKVCQ